MCAFKNISISEYIREYEKIYPFRIPNIISVSFASILYIQLYTDLRSWNIEIIVAIANDQQ